VTIRGQVRDQIIAELNAGLPTGVPEATKRRYIPGEKLTSPRLAVFFAEEEDERPGGSRGPLTKRSLTIAIQAMARCALPEEADDLIEPMLEHIVSVMGDTNLAGLALDVAEVSTVWATANDAAFYIVALCRWRIDFQTKKADLTLKQ
jgi:hypothetical protein